MKKNYDQTTEEKSWQSNFDKQSSDFGFFNYYCTQRKLSKSSIPNKIVKFLLARALKYSFLKLLKPKKKEFHPFDKIHIQSDPVFRTYLGVFL